MGYAHLRTGDPPSPINPIEIAKYDPLAWEVEAEGLRAATRQELDLPLTLGPVKVVPYVLGELAHWGQDINGLEVTRAYGQVGIRTALPLWRADSR